jgi:hypothetical protein
MAASLGVSQWSGVSWLVTECVSHEWSELVGD